MTESLFDPALFRRELRELLDRENDPELKRVIAACLDERITRQELRQIPAYQQAISAYYRDHFEAQRSAGVDFGAIRARVREFVEAEDASHGTDFASQFLTPAEDPPARTR